MPDSLLFAHAGVDQDLPALAGSRWFTGWSFEPLPLAGIALVGALYLLGVRRLHAGGNDWPLSRTVAFLGGGLGSMVLATASPLATYDTVLLSVHMVQHMILAMIAPVFLALGAPITLALRTLPPGGRSRLLTLLHSRVAAFFTHPLVAGAIFVLNPFVLYFSGLYPQTLEHPWLHDLNHLHFVLVGSLWFAPLLGVDPMPRRSPYPMRVISAFMTLPFHAFLGVGIMSMNTLIAGNWYLGQGRQWGASPASDQRTAGGILWVSGDLIGLIVFAALFRGWIRESEREARREDRRLDRLDAAAPRAAATSSVASGPPGPVPGGDRPNARDPRHEQRSEEIP